MDYCVSSNVMKECDFNTIENGISSIELMNRAATEVYNNYDFKNKSVAILCGKGNNGGDGYALAIILLENNITPTIYKIGDPKTESSLFYFNKLKNMNFENILDYTQIKYNYDVLVDCVFGVGFKGELKDELKDFFKNINNNFSNDIISVDIPSGLNSDNGVGKNAINATYTFAIQSYKLGHFLSDGKDKCGKLRKCDIGIKMTGEKYNIIDTDYIKKFFPKRLNNTNKGTFGKSVIIGGCKNYIGAVKLAYMAESSLRMGCGLSTLAVPSSLIPSISNVVFDNTLYELADKDGYIAYDKPSLSKLIEKVDAIAVGMGMGDHYDENRKVLDYLIHNFNGKLLIDADGINSLENHLELLNDASAQIILTPHPKEMSRLIKKNTEYVIDNSINIVQDFSHKYNLTLLLKGTSTIITNNEKTYIMESGTPGLAKGGSGDVLSGTIVGLMARGLTNIDAGACGSYINAVANNIAKFKYGEYGVLASDTAKEIGEALNYLLNNN